MALENFSLQEIKARPTRVLLTFLSIAIGVGAVVAVLLATSTTKSAQSRMLKAVAGRADVEVLANSPEGFPYPLIKQIRGLESVEVAIPSLNRISTLFADERKVRTQVLGIDPRIDQDIREYELASGKQIGGFGEVLIDESLANSSRIQVNEQVKLLGRGGLKEFKVVGLARPSNSSGVSLGGAVYMLLPAAQQLFSTGNQVDQILVAGKQGTSSEQLIADIDALTVDSVSLGLDEPSKATQTLSSSVTVRAPRTSSDMARETMFATENGMRMAIAFAVLIAIFIIYNTFQMAVGERRKQLGILRAVGATRKQITQMILRESLWLSAAGTVVGCLLGYFGAGLLNTVTESILQVELPQVELSVLPFFAASAVGIGVALLGAWLPAKRAGEVHPLAAMRAIEPKANEAVIRQTAPYALVAIPLGFILLYFATQGVLPIGSDVVAIVMILLGCVLLIPTLLGPTTSLLARCLRPWMQVEPVLAQKQIMRHVNRSSLTVGVLFIAASTSVGMTGNIMDNVDNVQSWYKRAIIGDFFIRGSTPDFATGSSADLPAGLVEQIREVPSIAKVASMTFVNAQSRFKPPKPGSEEQVDTILVIAREFDTHASNYFDLIEGDVSKVIDELAAGKVVVGSVLAQRRNLEPGDFIELESPDGAASLEVAAVTNEYIGGGLTVYMPIARAAKLLRVEGVSALVVDSEKENRKQVEAALQKICSAEGLILQSHSDMVAFIQSMTNGVIASMWMLLGLGCAIAAMGLVNTLAMNILEQTREIGMLRVLAMTKSQVRRMVLAQAILLGIMGLIPGALAGIFVAYAISQSSMLVLGHDILFQFRPLLVTGCVFLGVLIVLISSLIPAEQAARLKPALALKYE